MAAGISWRLALANVSYCGVKISSDQWRKPINVSVS